MKKFIWLRILISIVLIAALGFFGFFALLIAAFSEGRKFYAPMVMVVSIGMMIFVIAGAVLAPKLKKLFLVFLSFAVVCSIAIVSYNVMVNYDKSIPVLNDQGVDLNQYKPFAQGTKAVVLEEQSNLKLTSHQLPVMDGATALYPLYAAFAQEVYPQKGYKIDNSEVMCNNTIGAYENLMNGRVDIIFAARPSQMQIQRAAEKGIEFKLTPIGREAFVFFVNAKNPVTGLTTSQIQDIYSGKITNWKDVGGKDEPIRAFQRKENSGSQTMLEKFMEGKPLMEPPMVDRFSGMGEIIVQTADYKNYKNSIGFSFLFFSTEMVKNNQIRLLRVDGIYPDRNTIKNKEYPLVTDFYAVTANSGKPNVERGNPNVERLIEWILSPQGQKIVEETGYTSIN